DDLVCFERPKTDFGSVEQNVAATYRQKSRTSGRALTTRHGCESDRHTTCTGGGRRGDCHSSFLFPACVPSSEGDFQSANQSQGHTGFPPDSPSREEAFTYCRRVHGVPAGLYRQMGRTRWYSLGVGAAHVRSSSLFICSRVLQGFCR